MKTLTKFLIGISTFAPLSALAAVSGSGIDRVHAVPRVRLDFGNFLDIINRVIDWFFTLLLVLAVVFILWAAFKYLTAGGDEEKIGNAHQILLWAVVAIAVALLSQGLVFIVQQLVGVNAV